MRRKIILFSVMTIFMTIFSYFFTIVNGDELWNYGFSYNIVKGAIPYKDFNMVLLPLYSLIMAIPLRFIGNNLFVYHLSNAIFICSILTIVDNNKTFNTICLFLFITLESFVYGYNCFIMTLLILALYLENSKYKYKNELIGIVLGCILATKQNIGIMLFIPYILHSKEKIKSICYYLIPITITIIYLIFNDALFECIDYCFLGLKNFNSNFIIKSPIFIIIIIILIIFLINRYRKTKDINYLYLLFFLTINYPLFEIFHFMIGIIPLVYYLLEKENNYYLNMVLYSFPIVIICLAYIHPIITNGLYLSNIDVYKYRNVGENVDSESIKIVNFIGDNSNPKIFNFTLYSYFVKIAMDKKIDKFDLINKGNMGSNEEKYIEDIDKTCRNKKCLFLINEYIFEAYGSQTNPIIKDYVINNYEFCKNITHSNSLYCKKKTE